MRHFKDPRFTPLYNALPTTVRDLADKNFALLKQNPKHPLLHFKRLKGNLWSVRIGLAHRALAVEKDVAQELGLTEEERTNLLRFCDKREIEALRIAVAVPREEQAAKLAPFVAESERIGLAMLTDEQKLRLQQIRISRAGMGTLTEEAIAAQLKLSDEQKAEIERLLAERDEKLAGLDEDAGRATYDEYERKLRGVLNDMQVMGWDLLAGMGAPAQVAAADKRDEDKPAEEKPDETKPEEAKPAAPAGPRCASSARVAFGRRTTPP